MICTAQEILFGLSNQRARGGAVDWGTALQAGRSRVVSRLCHWI